MCTAISERFPRHLFGRTLDVESTYGEGVVTAPRAYRYPHLPPIAGEGYAMIGVAHMADGIPLYYDGMNEHGLCAAALNFPSSAVYRKNARGGIPVPSSLLLPYVLRRAKTVAEARRLIARVTVTDTPAHPSLPPTPLHWIFSDGKESITVEPLKMGTMIYENSVHVLTNAPPFTYHMRRAADYMLLSPRPPKNRLSPESPLAPYSRGMGACGLPGDFSSASRFVRALFMKTHTLPAVPSPESDAVRRFFTVLQTVAVPPGTVIAENGLPVSTVYTSCADPENKTYYVLPSERWAPLAVRMEENALGGATPTVTPFHGEK